MKYLVPVLAVASITALASAGSNTNIAMSVVPQSSSISESVLGPDVHHLTTYRACSRKAETIQLQHAEALSCLDAYTRLKLSFLPDVSFEDYQRLSVTERWAVNKHAYAAYSDWIAEAGRTD